jgi:hypothetical protein
LFYEVEKGLDPCLCGRSEKTLNFVRRKMVIQELDDVHSEFPAGNDPPARQVLVDGPTVSERYFTPELDTVNNHFIMNFDHFLFSPL